MGELKAVKAAESKAKEILAKRAEELKVLAEQIDREAAAIARAKEEMQAATIAGDLKAYQQAKAARRDAEDAKEMHEARIHGLNDQPLISKGEYDKAVADIYAELAATDDKAKQQLAAYSDKMEAVAEELRQDMEKANAVLHLLQANVYKDADRTKDRNGHIIRVPHEDKTIDKWTTISWGKAGVTHYQYGEYTGRRVEDRSDGKQWVKN